MYDVVLFNTVPDITELSRGIGVYRLATELRKNGYSTFVIDYASFMDIEQFEKIISKVVNNDTKMFGISSTWFGFQRDRLFSTSDFRNVLDKYSNSYKLTIGGAFAYEFLEEDFDHIFIGHSENQIIDFLNNNKSQKIIDWDRKANTGAFDFNSSITEFTNTDIIHSDEILGLETSRGCIFNCAFCNYPHKGQNTRNFMKYEDILYQELMNNYKRYGITRYSIIDDTFNDYTDKLIKIKNVIDRLPFKPSFWAYIRFDLIDAHPEQAQLLYDIGIKAAMHGFETWNENTSKVIKKGSRHRKINGMKIAKKIWKNDVFINCFYIVGLPKDNIEDVYSFVNFWKEQGYKFIDSVTAFPLYLRDLNSKYAILSDIEKNKQIYGYTMIGQKEWIRNDEGNIHSFKKALELASFINAECSNNSANGTWSWHPYADRLNITNRYEASKKFFDEVYYKNLLKVINEF